MMQGRSAFSRTPHAQTHTAQAHSHLDVQGGLQHAAVLDELRHDAGHHVDGDGKAHSGPGAGGGEHGRVDADHPPSRVQQRAPEATRFVSWALGVWAEASCFVPVQELRQCSML